MRKLLIILLCSALIISLIFSNTSAQAADSYLISIVEDKVIEDIGDNQMAVYIDGIVYIPYTLLEHMNDLTVVYNEDSAFVAVYRIGKMLHFELKTGTTYDYLNKHSINVPAKMRKGIPYLPIAVLANWMDLYFSCTPVFKSGLSYPILRLNSDTPSTSDDVLIRKLSSKINSVIERRDKIDKPAPPPIIPERTLAIMFTGPVTEPDAPAFLVSEILDTLSEFKLSASFFFSETEIVPSAETLREIYARGFYPGIILTDSTSPIEEARRCSAIYAQVLHTRVRLVTTGNIELTEEQKSELSNAGFLLWEPDHDPDTEETTSNQLLSKVRSSLQNAEVSSVLRFYPNTKTLDILPVLFSYLDAQNFTVIAMTDLIQPF